jgi:hypothetical protein
MAAPRRCAAVTLVAFQRALCDLVASPALVRRLWDEPEAVLADYELSVRERARLEAVARQPGMATSCALYRMNRVTPLYTYLRLTCHALGSDLRRELDLFWELQPAHAQFAQEVARFGAFVRSRVRDGALPPLVEEVLDLELAVNELRYGRGDSAGEAVTASGGLTLREDARVVRLSREPLALLAALDRREPVEDVPVALHYVLVVNGDDGLDVLPLAPELGEPLFAIARGDAPSISAETVAMLCEAGFLVDPATSTSVTASV